MVRSSPLLERLAENKEKILTIKKYSEEEYNKLIEDLTQAEEERIKVLEKIKETNSVDLQNLASELGIPEERVNYDVQYLKELGLLEPFGLVSKFYKSIENKNEIEGLFPNIAVIRDKKICSGCGLCASVCPTNSIHFENDALKIYDEVCIKCGLCYSGCPRSFFPKELKKIADNASADAKYLKQFNFYGEVFTAHTKDDAIKEVGQDGGIVTSLFKTSFEKDMVDAVLAVGVGMNAHEPLPLFVENEVDLLKTAGTRYANAHALRILHNGRKYKRLAIIGTACALEALQKISVYPLNKPFYDNITLKIGLFCMESFDYENILNIIHKEFPTRGVIDPYSIKKMDINKGRFYLYRDNNTSLELPLSKIKKYGRFGCFLCSDLTAGLCDISVGSIGSEPEWSTVITRSNKGTDLLQKSIDLNLVEKQPIEEDSKSFTSLSRIATSKLKLHEEIPRQVMKEQDPKERIQNFNEVPFGFTLEQAKLEAQRCMQCGNPLCVTGCPVKIDIPKFIRLIKQEKLSEAINHIKYFNLLPAICGRVCPQETQCEETCLLGAVDDPIAIGTLERFIADWEREGQTISCPECRDANGIKVGIIGSGPAGLTCAGELLMRGYDITVFEAFHAGGGVLVYGIPEFRLPKAIVKQEIETLKMIGGTIKYNMIIGKILTLDDLREMGFKAFFVGVGAGLPMFLRVPGLALNGVLTANEFLTRANLMKAYRFPEYDTPIKIGNEVCVIGGGNVAMDSARVALRLGAEKVYIVYRRSKKEMPARRAEYHHGKEEGIIFRFLTNPVEFIGDENGHVKQMKVIKMELGEPDDSGRRRPIPIEGSEYIIDVDTVIIAIGTRANPILTNSAPEIKLNKWGYIEADETGRTSVEDVWAGGDIVTGAATVISAMGAGKEAAEEIDEYLTQKYLGKEEN